MPVPEVPPEREPFLLCGPRRDDCAYRADFQTARTLRTAFLNLLEQAFIFNERTVRSGRRGHGIDHFRAVVSGAEFRKRGEVGALLGSHVVDGVQIRVEAGEPTREDEDRGQQQESRRERAPEPLRDTHASESEPDGLIAAPLPVRHEHRQEYKHEDNRSDEHQSADESEIAECRGLHEGERKEGEHGCQVSDGKRSYDVPERLARVRLIFQIIDIMQRVIDCYAEDYASDSEDYNRNR